MLASVVPAASAGSDRVGGYIVVLKDSVDDPGAVAREHARDNGAQVDFVYGHALKGYAAMMSDQAAARIAQDGRVRLVQRDQAVHALGHGANAPTGVSRTFATANTNIGIDGHDDKRVDVDVAIIDTGIDLDHPDLNVAGGKNCQKGTSYDDGNGHGTHVAGSVGGLDNGAGAVGMAPGARLWAVRVLDNSGSGSWSSVICGVDWVTANAGTIEVANMSLGGSGSDGPCGSSSLHLAICNSVESGVTYAVAAGNSSADSKDHVPAAYNEVITVSALADFDGAPSGLGSPTCRTDVDDTFANFSNYGADVDVIAPGVCIRSTWKGGGYNTISGTSMASPHVAGAAALYKSSHPTASPADVQAAIVTNGNLGWTWPSEDKDLVQEPLLDVGSTATAAAAFAPLFAGAPPPANVAPTAELTAPVAGSTVTGTAVPVSATASDSDGTVSKVEFYVDSAATPFASGTLGTDGVWRTTWDSTTVANGTHTLKAVAADNGGATGSSPGVSVTVDNPVPALKQFTSVVTTKVGSTTKKGPWLFVDLKVSAADAGGAVSGASIALDVKSGDCSGSVVTSGSGTTGTDGAVTFQFKTRTPGPYCAATTASKDGYEPRAGSDPFTV
jgi:subtilisin family serine protease